MGLRIIPFPLTTQPPCPREDLLLWLSHVAQFVACPMLVTMLFLHHVDAPTICFALVYILKVNLLFVLVTHVGNNWKWIGWQVWGFSTLACFWNNPSWRKPMQMYQDFPRKTNHQLSPQAVNYILKPTLICNFPTSGSICDDL
jgi:energy-coupling factor transporter transmembrane protein EcfT